MVIDESRRKLRCDMHNHFNNSLDYRNKNNEYMIEKFFPNYFNYTNKHSKRVNISLIFVG